MKNEKLQQKHYMQFNAIQKVCFFFYKTHLQLISMKYGAYETCHGKAQKINQPRQNGKNH
jgi:hypothetical protein